MFLFIEILFKHLIKYYFNQSFIYFKIKYHTTKKIID